MALAVGQPWSVSVCLEDLEIQVITVPYFLGFSGTIIC